MYIYIVILYIFCQVHRLDRREACVCVYIYCNIVYILSGASPGPPHVGAAASRQEQSGCGASAQGIRSGLGEEKVPGASCRLAAACSHPRRSGVANMLLMCC